MSRKIIDYILVEFSNNSLLNMPDYLRRSSSNEELKLSLHLRSIDLEILILENSKEVHFQLIKDSNELLNTVQDFLNYKIPENVVLFYKEKYDYLHPLKGTEYYTEFEKTEDEFYRTQLNKELKEQQRKVDSIENEIKKLEKEKESLDIKMSKILEKDKNLDLETCRSYFERIILYYLEKGYEPQGGVSISQNKFYDFTYCQAMVKYES